MNTIDSKARRAVLVRVSWSAWRSLFLVAALLASRADPTTAQSPIDGFDPNANGTVQVVVVQPDGKILLGGDFTTLSPNGGTAVTRNRIARLNPDGTIDSAFDPSANATVYAIAVQPDGKILVGGSFNGVNSIGGQTRNFIARLDGATGATDSFDPNANNIVYSLALQPDGKILVGGAFSGASSIGGQTRNHLARLDAATGAADSFDPNANSDVRAIVVQPDGRIVVGGAFNGVNSIGGQTRQRIARLDPTTGMADTFNPSANGLVRTLALQADANILAGGAFNGANSIGGQTRNRIARLDPTTGAADSFDPNANVGNVYSIVVQPDGRILVGGTFTVIAGQARNRIARLAQTGAADGFDPNTSSLGIFAMAVQQDGKVLTGGIFSTVTPNGGAAFTRNNIARLEADGRLDRTLDAQLLGGNVFATAVQPDGKILIGGTISQAQGTTRRYIARLHTDGSLDSAFETSADGGVYALAVQADGTILAGGTFHAIGGRTRNNIARLDPNTGLADSFDPFTDPNGSVLSIVVQANGKILLGGGFVIIGNQQRPYIGRIDGTTGLADSFNPQPDDTVQTIAVQEDGKVLLGGEFFNLGGQARRFLARVEPTFGSADAFNPTPDGGLDTVAVQRDGKIVAGGSFTGIGGQTRPRIARLDATTGLADSFKPNANNRVVTTIVQADGNILAGGFFTTMGGQPRDRIARLDADTGVPDSFAPNASAFVGSLAVQADGKILAGGSFTSVGGQVRNLLARLSNNVAALQNLAVTQSAITWTRGGASPEFTRVTFEQSTDSVNYTPLGSGSRSGSNWSLTGLNLPTNQNLYIRARGFYRSGFRNGSESIQQSVRNAFLSSLQLTTAVSRKTHGAAGTFDIALPLSGEPGVECRSSSGAHALVFTFTNDVVSGNAAVTSGVANVSGTPTFAGHTMTVDLAGVADVQKVTVSLSNVTDSVGQVLPATGISMNMLIGDINGSKAVSASDIGAVKAQSGATVDAANFRSDVAVSGSVTASDIGLVKSRSGQSVP